MTASAHKGGMGTLFAVVMDVNHLDLCGTFWSQMLGVDVLFQDDHYLRLGHPGERPTLLLQKVTEPHQEKNRVHIDLDVTDLEASVNREQDLGGHKLQAVSAYGIAWVVMADPDGMNSVWSNIAEPFANQGATPMEQRLSLITLGVNDLTRSRQFYEQGLGWVISSGSNEQIVFFQVGRIALALYSRAALAADAHLANDGTGFGGITLAYNVRQREDVDAILTEAQAAGARLLKPAEEVHWGGYSGYFADPDGYPWEVAWNPYWELLEDGSVQLPR